MSFSPSSFLFLSFPFQKEAENNQGPPLFLLLALSSSSSTLLSPLFFVTVSRVGWMPNGRDSIQVEAFDRDAGENGRVEYSLMETASTKGRFRIHPHSGVVHALKSLAAGQEFSFTVRASDGGQPSRNATTRVSVTVLGVPERSENPPELGTDNSRRADVMESDPVGHAVAFITANDPDGDMLWYKIEGRSRFSLSLSLPFSLTSSRFFPPYCLPGSLSA